MDRLVGQRVILVQNIQLHEAGEKGVIASWRGYVGVVFDNQPSALVLTHAGYPITNFVQGIEDDRLTQQSFDFEKGS